MKPYTQDDDEMIKEQVVLALKRGESLLPRRNRISVWSRLASALNRTSSHVRAHYNECLNSDYDRASFSAVELTLIFK